jgi:hypothetical protein
MESNFNPNNYKVYPTTELLYNEVTDYEIYRYYIGDFSIGKAFSSPLLKDDNPSFGIYPSSRNPGLLFFKDHRGPSGDAIKFVQLLYNYSSRNETIERVIIDFNLEDKFFVSNKELKQTKPIEYRLSIDERKEYKASKLDLRITSRSWEKCDIDFWKSYGISLSILQLFNVVPIKYYFMYNNIYIADKYAYAYKEYKDEELNYKIYQPFRKQNDHKFLNGFLDGTFSGWNLLPEIGELLILSKSNKDTMFLHEHGYNVISPQGEGYIYKFQVIDILKSRFKRIITFFDHDTAGINAAKRNRELYGFEFITTCDFKYKDISDYYKGNGLLSTMNLLKEIIK